MLERILVPLDGSEAAEAALKVAELIPSRSVRLLAVESEVTDLGTLCRADRDCHAYLERVAEPLRRQGRDVDALVVLGNPAEQIIALSATADLVVMGSHGRGGIGRLVLGNVADQVARRALAPTMIVRNGQRSAIARPFTRVVVPIDGWDLAEEALPMAITLAESHGLPLHLIRVVPFDPARAIGEAGATAATAYAKSPATNLRLAAAYLAEQVQILRNRNVSATSELRTGAPANQLLDAIKAGDLVVLATRARSGVDRLVLGSVAEELVGRAVGPVVLVRSPAAASLWERHNDRVTAAPTANAPVACVGAHRDE